MHICTCAHCTRLSLIKSPGCGIPNTFSMNNASTENQNATLYFDAVWMDFSKIHNTLVVNQSWQEMHVLLSKKVFEDSQVILLICPKVCISQKWGPTIWTEMPASLEGLELIARPLLVIDRLSCAPNYVACSIHQNAVVNPIVSPEVGLPL